MPPHLTHAKPDRRLPAALSGLSLLIVVAIAISAIGGDRAWAAQPLRDARDQVASPAPVTPVSVRRAQRTRPPVAAALAASSEAPLAHAPLASRVPVQPGPTLRAHVRLALLNLPPPRA